MQAVQMEQTVLCGLVHLAILLLEDLLGFRISEIAWRATNPNLAASKERVDLLETQSCRLREVDVEEDSNNSIGNRPWNAARSASSVTILLSDLARLTSSSHQCALWQLASP